MKEKYYTPTQEELHIGLECEVKLRQRNGVIAHIRGEHEYINDWAPYTVGEELNEGMLLSSYVYPFHISDALSFLKDGALRVKYLDEVDIEDMLGVECKIGGSYQFTRDSVFRPNWLRGAHVYKVRVYFHPDDNWVKIEFYLAPDGEWEKFFEGSVKNKSEMQTILKSLGIV